MFQPEVPWSKTILVTACNDGWERSRLEWRVGEGGNPAAIAENFLAAYGMGLPISADSQHANTHGYHYASDVCGATLFVSAAGGAAMHGISAGAASPAPAVPDLAVVVYNHGYRPELSLRNSARRTTRLARKTGNWHVGGWTPSWTPQEHASAVAQVREAIARGDVYQVTVVGHASAPYQGDPLAALGRVASLPGANYGRLLTGARATDPAGDHGEDVPGGWAIATASPELLVRVAADPRATGEPRLMIETRPIKGTRPATAAGRVELLASPKERAEHVMIVDLERNDLAQVAEIGSVDVPELFAVRRWCDLWQAESVVRARVATGFGLADILRAVLPGGSVTGAPKLAALAEIARLEPVGRGPSMGALGWLDHRGLELGLTIRTVAADGERLHLWAGGGITWGSDPIAEVAEAAAKARPVQAALAGD
jgi:para-aminobenzoate synthetase component I